PALGRAAWGPRPVARAADDAAALARPLGAAALARVGLGHFAIARRGEEDKVEKRADIWGPTRGPTARTPGLSAGPARRPWRSAASLLEAVRAPTWRPRPSSSTSSPATSRCGLPWRSYT
ncbi:unnamed protein product, partial [Prorocentrum cordatum]